MFNSQTVKSTKPSKLFMSRFEGMRSPLKGRRNAGAGKKGAIERQRSWRMKRLSQKIFLWLMVPVVLGSFCWLVYTLLLGSDIFRITHVSVLGHQVTTQQQVLKAAGLHRGKNMLTLDISGIENLISKETWIEKVWVKRRWPSTVEIVVREYKPFALVNLDSDGNRKLYYLSNKGVVFAPATAEKDLDYPVMNGPGLADDLQGMLFRENSLGAQAFEFLGLTAKGSRVLPTQAVSEINVDPGKGLIVYLVDHPFPIYMGKDNVQLRFARLVKVLAKLYKDEKIKGVAEIRMDYADNKILVARIDEAS